MKAEISCDNIIIEVDLSDGMDISIPLNFNGNQPNTYNVEKAVSTPYEHENFIGDTRKGGPCNFETYRLTPHCNGTHTECIGHITDERIDILSSLNEEMILSTLISINPKISDENYTPRLNSDDLVITKDELKKLLEHIDTRFLKGLIIRTLPNNQSKKTRDYMKALPAFFSTEAMEYIISLGVHHLLVDTPSVDRLFDDGCLSSHNIFWQTKNKKCNPETQNKTITEMIFVENHIKDGSYLLNLQIPSFLADAAPSRPIIYNINEL